jgi:hypothetical protein
MKTTSRIQIGGTPIRRADRSFARSSRNGSGISGWNWANSSRQPRCAAPNLLQPLRRKLSHKQRRDLWKRPHLRSAMALPTGRVLLLRMAFPALLSLPNPMERCVVLPIIPCILKSGVPNVMGPCGSCMLPASAIAVPAPCEHSVKKAPPRSNHDG